MTSLAPRRGRQLQAQQQRRGDPFSDLENRMGSLLQNFFADPFPAVTAAAVPVWVPPVDIEETEDSYILEIDLPGVRPEDVNLELRDNNELRISGQYRERERAGIMRRQSRRSGQFEYDVILPGEVDPEKIDATLEDGVLLVRLGKSAGGQPRRIQVRGGGTGGEIGGTGAGRSQPQAGGRAEATTGGVSSAEGTATGGGTTRGAQSSTTPGASTTGGPATGATGGGRGSRPR